MQDYATVRRSRHGLFEWPQCLIPKQLGFNVTEVDSNPSAIHMLQQIISEERIDNIQAQVYDINNASLAADFGFVSCTVTLMFLDPARVNTVILDMQERTLPGGYNLIVCAMSVADHPCPIPFRLTFKEW